MNEVKRRFALRGLKLFDISHDDFIVWAGDRTRLHMVNNRGVGIEEFFSVRVKLSNCIAFVSIVLAWQIIFSFCGLYDSSD